MPSLFNGRAELITSSDESPVDSLFETLELSTNGGTLPADDAEPSSCGALPGEGSELWYRGVALFDSDELLLLFLSFLPFPGAGLVRLPLDFPCLFGLLLLVLSEPKSAGTAFCDGARCLKPH